MDSRSKQVPLLPTPLCAFLGVGLGAKGGKGGGGYFQNCAYVFIYVFVSFGDLIFLVPSAGFGTFGTPLRWQLGTTLYVFNGIMRVYTTIFIFFPQQILKHVILLAFSNPILLLVQFFWNYLKIWTKWARGLIFVSNVHGGYKIHSKHHLDHFWTSKNA